MLFMNKRPEQGILNSQRNAGARVPACSCFMGEITITRAVDLDSSNESSDHVNDTTSPEASNVESGSSSVSSDQVTDTTSSESSGTEFNSSSVSSD
ncbi:hypothetical protein ZIOFF_036365 [Zingiber officinale]|uniref:Uncharacterized protein n=1 Tax=Zingiber officinale TaxID=94328 RepID=A0A8J5L7Y6_ZINOF|nr:hypothetical protein ZIOFF_036365 [Zingiber officinale]